MGVALPPLLRRLYCQVANGHIGPSYGVFPLSSHDGHDETVELMYRRARRHPRWPVGVVPLCDFGSDIWTCVDCSVEGGAIVNREAATLAWVHEPLEDWFTKWIEGVDLFEDMRVPGTEVVRTAFDPHTRERVVYRGPGRLRGTLVELDSAET